MPPLADVFPRGLLPPIFGLLIAMLLFAPSPAHATEQVRAVELTFLKSTPGNREKLKQYIVLNWFAMDRIAKAQGLMESFTVLDTATDEGAWNVLVSVTYRDEKGYEGIKEQFERIRSAHKTVLVDGKTLRELGTFVESRKLYENPAHATR